MTKFIRTSWMANNAIPDPIIMHKIYRNTESLKSLNAIKPVIRRFTAMDVAKPVKINVFPQEEITTMSCSIFTAPCDAIQVARR